MNCECFSEIGKCLSVVESSRWIVSVFSEIGKCLSVVESSRWIVSAFQ